MQYLKFALIRKRIRGIIPMIKDKEVSFWKKFLLVFGIVYLFLPVDLIPPLVPVFGWFDDVILWIAIIYALRDELDKHSPDTEEKPEGAKVRKRTGLFRDRNVYDVEFTVKDDNSGPEAADAEQPDNENTENQEN